mmetsp:Transcript_5916/g.19589  ORF Transcript_5916/g.19589 Transcript_5916/m.19589 type:complete len:588 (+) Transcript_5916:1502-3265(+)
MVGADQSPVARNTRGEGTRRQPAHRTPRRTPRHARAVPARALGGQAVGGGARSPLPRRPASPRHEAARRYEPVAPTSCTPRRPAHHPGARATHMHTAARRHPRPPSPGRRGTRSHAGAPQQTAPTLVRQNSRPPAHAHPKTDGPFRHTPAGVRREEARSILHAPPPPAPPQRDVGVPVAPPPPPLPDASVHAPPPPPRPRAGVPVVRRTGSCRHTHPAPHRPLSPRRPPRPADPSLLPRYCRRTALHRCTTALAPWLQPSTPSAAPKPPAGAAGNVQPPVEPRAAEHAPSPCVNQQPPPTVNQSDPPALNPQLPNAVNRQPQSTVNQEDLPAAPQEDPPTVNQQDPAVVNRPPPLPSSICSRPSRPASTTGAALDMEGTSPPPPPHPSATPAEGCGCSRPHAHTAPPVRTSHSGVHLGLCPPSPAHRCREQTQGQATRRSLVYMPPAAPGEQPRGQPGAGRVPKIDRWCHGASRGCARRARVETATVPRETGRRQAVAAAPDRVGTRCHAQPMGHTSGACPETARRKECGDPRNTGAASTPPPTSSALPTSDAPPNGATPPSAAVPPSGAAQLAVLRARRAAAHPPQ